MPDQSKDDIISMMKDSADQIGLDDESSSAICANLNDTTLPMCIGTPITEIDVDDVTLIYFIIDESPSMGPVEQTLIDGFNEIVIEGLKGASQDDVCMMEVGGLVFSHDFHPMWGSGFKKINDLPALSAADYNVSRGRTTSLYDAVLNGITAISVRATTITNGLGFYPKSMIVILSDGADNTSNKTAAEVKKIVDKLSSEIFVKAFVGFNTGTGADFKTISNEIGFGKPFEMKRGGSTTDEQMKKDFRHMLGVMSSSLIQQSKTKIGADSSNNFWDSK